jgi:hypothetical protein
MKIKVGDVEKEITINPAAAIEEKATAEEVMASIEDEFPDLVRLVEGGTRVVLESPENIRLETSSWPIPTFTIFDFNNEPQTIQPDVLPRLNTTLVNTDDLAKRTSFHSNDTYEHRDYVIQLMVDYRSNVANGKTSAPHSRIYYTNSDHTTNDRRLCTAIHEIGHTFTQDSTNTYHNTHGTPSNCAAVSPLDWSLYFCPRHVKEFRKSVNKSWTVNHTKIGD